MSETEITLGTLQSLAKGEDWRLQLAHDRPYHLLIWITRGQGRLLLDGQRKGVGTHNAIFVPAGALFSVEIGRQTTGLAVTIPAATPLRLPERPRLLRIRDVHVQTELTGFIDAASRENQRAAPLYHDALEAHMALVSVWLRRQIALPEHMPERSNAAQRLSAKFAHRVSAHYATGAAMAEHAAALGVTPTHLTRAVKAATGKTAADILTERVLHAALSLLSGTPHPAKQIAQHLGFGSAAYFTRFIKHHTGHAPSALRG
ncbi:MAG: AraC family transcriptional regulator [Sulfitobacter sp.]